ncbi:MAG: hypothetical protein FRX49_00104 [Trebouxia sp. A1-2]|nr:MAG: hypothetical protein FRX49_00104 [Trebouxia sp. A1-2]
MFEVTQGATQRHSVNRGSRRMPPMSHGPFRPQRQAALQPNRKGRAAGAVDSAAVARFLTTRTSSAARHTAEVVLVAQP